MNNDIDTALEAEVTRRAMALGIRTRQPGEQSRAARDRPAERRIKDGSRSTEELRMPQMDQVVHRGHIRLRADRRREKCRIVDEARVKPCKFQRQRHVFGDSEIFAAPNRCDLQFRGNLRQSAQELIEIGERAHGHAPRATHVDCHIRSHKSSR